MCYLSWRSLIVYILGIHWLSICLTAPVVLAADIAQAPTERRNPAVLIPPQIADAARRDLAYKINIHPANFRIKAAERQAWPDSCLGLPEPEEVCAMSLVEGWRVVLSYKDQTWTYHTDYTGRSVRLEKSAATQATTTVNIPPTVLSTVLTQMSLRTGIPSQFTLTIEPKEWKDGCLELGDPETFCTMAIVSGWRVIIESGKKRWVYHTDSTGALVKLNLPLSK